MIYMMMKSCEDIELNIRYLMLNVFNLVLKSINKNFVENLPISKTEEEVSCD